MRDDATKEDAVNQRLALAAGIILVMAGCGFYTNVPAQVHVKTVDVPAKLEYKFDSSLGKVIVVATNPKVTFESLPGSIGITYDEMIVSYRTSDDKTMTDTPAGGLKIRTTVRVPSSHLVRDTAGNVTAGGNSGSVELGVLSPLVSKFGLTNFDKGNPTMLITLNGEDDARWQHSLTLNLPIQFAGSPACPANVANCP
jgi:hypothetical protein